MELYSIFMVLGFSFTVYSVIANDSMQTLGTFIASNKKVKWQYLWLFITSILLFTIWYSWFAYSWDISYWRLDRIPFQEIQWYHVAAPISLVILTRYWIPVSTSLLVLSTFASWVVFSKILTNSLLWYSIAFIVAMVLWYIISKFFENYFKAELSKKSEQRWRYFQWFSTWFLWWSWLTHDMANISVFLPRNIELYQMFLVSIAFSLALLYIFAQRWWKIQELILSKTNIEYIKTATLIDLVYAFILLYFKEYNNIPMSTTWVFVWLLAWREFWLYATNKNIVFKDLFPIVWKDLIKVLFGLAISIITVLLVQWIWA